MISFETIKRRNFTNWEYFIAGERDKNLLYNGVTAKLNIDLKIFARVQVTHMAMFQCFLIRNKFNTMTATYTILEVDILSDKTFLVKYTVRYLNTWRDVGVKFNHYPINVKCRTTCYKEKFV